VGRVCGAFYLANSKSESQKKKSVKAIADNVAAPMWYEYCEFGRRFAADAKKALC
jgi:hypothetical protein